MIEGMCHLYVKLFGAIFEVALSQGSITPFSMQNKIK